MITAAHNKRGRGTWLPLVTFCTLLAGCNPATGPSGLGVTVTGIAPAAGATAGGTPVTISGSNFATGATVTIGGVPATAVSVAGPGSLTAVTGPRGAGAVDVTVTVSGTSGTLTGGFTYVAPTGSNSPPTIHALTARGTRPNQPPAFADLGEGISVTATASDPETTSALVYEWSAAAGTFEGSGASVIWRAPQTFTTPGTVLLTLTVVDRYTTPGPGGMAVPQEHRVTANIAVNVHDSVREVGDMARKFLLLFSDSSVPPEVVVQDFLSGCGAGGMGREAELNDVIENRAEVTITQHTIGTAQVTVNFGGVCPFRNRAGDACAQVPAEWRDVEIGTGIPGYTVATEHLTAIYNGSRWGLCDAEIEGTHVRGGVFLPISRFLK